MKNFDLISYDGQKLIMYLWDEVENPKGVVQLIHGMSEHLGRYDNFAKFLNSQGFIVLGDDHRAHGKTAGTSELVGKVEKGKDIFSHTIQDELFIIQKFKKEYNDLPYFIFSHSYGSFMTQRIIQLCNQKLDGVVLCGSAYLKNTIDTLTGKVFSSLRPQNSIAKFIEYVSFHSYNKKFKNGYWITRDDEIGKSYYNDPFSGVAFTNGFYHSLFKGMLGNYKKENIENAPKDLPIFIISGKADPISKNGKRTEKLYQFYLKNGFQHVSMKLYKDARHELINEINKDEVFYDVVNFFNKNI